MNQCENAFDKWFVSEYGELTNHSPSWGEMFDDKARSKIRSNAYQGWKTCWESHVEHLKKEKFESESKLLRRINKDNSAWLQRYEEKNGSTES